MVKMAFDTHKAVKDLKKAGIAEEQAAAIVAVIRWAATGEYTSYAEFYGRSDEAESS